MSENKTVRGYKKENYIYPTSRWAKTPKRGFMFQLIVFVVFAVLTLLVVMAQFVPEINIFWKIVLVLTAGPILGVFGWQFLEYMDKHSWFYPLMKSGIWIVDVDDETEIVSEMRLTEGDLYNICNVALEEIET